jgi:hypothetical protein
MDEESALPVGTKVQAGQQIGVVGDTGEGREVTRGRFPPHLHLGWYDAGGSEGRTNLESGAMNPYPLLLWLEAHRGSVSGGTDASYCEAPQEPVPEPTDTSSDLDTGDPYDARPSPIIGDNQSSSERESGTDDASREENKRAGATSGNPEADPAGGIEKEDGVEDERDEERASRLNPEAGIAVRSACLCREDRARNATCI